MNRVHTMKKEEQQNEERKKEKKRMNAYVEHQVEKQVGAC